MNKTHSFSLPSEGGIDSHEPLWLVIISPNLHLFFNSREIICGVRQTFPQDYVCAVGGCDGKNSFEEFHRRIPCTNICIIFRKYRTSKYLFSSVRCMDDSDDR